MLAGLHLYSTLVTFASAATPAANSSAISLLSDSTKSGALFGGIAVIDVLAGTSLSPLVFGELFSWTIAWYAHFVFAIAAGMSSLMLVLILFVGLQDRLRRNHCPSMRTFYRLYVAHTVVLTAAIPSLRCKVADFYIPVLRTLA
jgi:hypothetical protein